MKIFISLPMNGKDEDDIDSAFYMAKKALEEHGLPVNDIIDSRLGAGTRFQSHDSRIKMLAESLKLLADADLVFFANGWHHARGCRVEHLVAVEYGKAIMYE